jgi:class 3 adenylate cyclase
VLVSGTTRDLAEGAAGLAFEPRGRYELKGIERPHEMFAAATDS